jgi:CubicO group peptidase (beta-lactamase class C family)
MMGQAGANHRWIITVFCVLAFVGHAKADSCAAPADPRFGPIAAEMRATTAVGKIPSIAVAVAKSGRVLWEDACGMADREAQAPATPDTPYDIGSISKVFTATALMTMVQDGRVLLDLPANDYLGPAKLRAFVGDANAATVERVLQHRAGLPMYANFITADEAYRRPSIDETIRRYGIIVRTPGEVFNYANLGYGVIEAIIEQVSGQAYADAMRQSVFQPLALTHTSVGPMPSLNRITAAPYDDNGKRLPRMDLDQRGAGYIYSSVHDLVRFGMFHLKDRVPGQQPVLSGGSIAKMVADRQPADGNSFYGLGWDIDPDTYGSGLMRVRHTGGQAGFAGMLMLLPKDDIAIAVLSNSRAGDTVGLSEHIASILLPDYGAKRDAALKADAATAHLPQTAPSPQFVGDWQGELITWMGKIPVRMRVAANGQIRVRYGDQPEKALYHVTFRAGEWDGSFAGTIPTPDAMRDKHTIYLDRMIVRGGQMFGAAIADAGAHYALPSFINLIRTN